MYISTQLQYSTQTSLNEIHYAFNIKGHSDSDLTKINMFTKIYYALNVVKPFVDVGYLCHSCVPGYIMDTDYSPVMTGHSY